MIRLWKNETVWRDRCLASGLEVLRDEVIRKSKLDRTQSVILMLDCEAMARATQQEVLIIHKKLTWNIFLDSTVVRSAGYSEARV